MPVVCATMPSASSRRLEEFKGVGPERLQQLHRLGLFTGADLLYHRPRRYEDRRHFIPIQQLEKGSWGTVRGTITVLGLKRWRHGTRSVFEFVLEDGSARLHCRWWNLPFMQNYFQKGDEVLVYGKLSELKPRAMDHPETEVVVPGEENFIHLNRIVPIYPLTEGLSQRWLRAFIWRSWPELKNAIGEPWPARLFPGLPSRLEAMQMLHFPETAEEPERARRRLAAEEFMDLQVVLQQRRQALRSRAQARPCPGDNHLVKPFLRAVGFAPSEAQKKVLREIRADLKQALPMRRLLQGDVGSGKTFVAAAVALMVLESGFNVVLMAPTEILASQHYETLGAWLRPLGIRVEIQTSDWKETGAGDQERIVVGTHALLGENFSIPNLGLVIIDEQHKFGVTQREGLLRKGDYPHLLILSATPIPRTLGLTLYGDLDLSILDSAPVERPPIRTFVRQAAERDKIFEFVRGQLSEGRQGYIIYPRVEQATAEVQALRKEVRAVSSLLAPFQVGAVDGKMALEEKRAVLSAFRDNQLQLLLATSMVEVGIDVPNASVMIIENAEQFGLAQLHQLRGRIGRGPHPSYCILINRSGGAEAGQRLQILAQTEDGFKIAEEDLRLRGAGDFLGSDQSGLPPFRFADFGLDFDLIEQARDGAREWLEAIS